MSDEGQKHGKIIRMPIIREVEPPTITVQVFRDGDGICALIGPDTQAAVGGFGDTVADALRGLASQIEAERDRFRI